MRVGRASFLAFVFALTSCNSGERAPAAVPVPPAASPARVPNAPPASGSLAANLERNHEEAESAGWRKKEVVELGPDAAVVLYKKANHPARAPRIARADAVTSGAYAPQSFVNGMIDVMRAPGGSFFWDLRGDKSTSIVLNLTPCAASCGIAVARVVELVGGRFVLPPSQPECPTCLGDRNRDGVPEFEVALLTLVVAPCSRVSCGPSLALRVEVRGYEAWDGEKYAREQAEFEPLYFEKLKHTRSEVARARRSAKKSKICPLGVLQSAAELFVYSRYIGESRGDALEQADDVLAGYSLGRCKQEYELLSEPKSWPELRAELAASRLPELKRTR